MKYEESVTVMLGLYEREVGICRDELALIIRLPKRLGSKWHHKAKEPVTPSVTTVTKSWRSTWTVLGGRGRLTDNRVHSSSSWTKPSWFAVSRNV